MKKYIKIGLALIMLVMLTLPIRVYAEDIPQEEVPVVEELPQSKWALYWEENIRPQAINLLSSFIGGVGGVGGLLFLTFRFIRKKTNKAIDNMNITNEEKQTLREYNDKMLDTMQGIVTDKLEPFIEKVDELAKVNLKLLEENEKLTDYINALIEENKIENQRLVDCVNVLTQEVSNKNNTITRILEIAFTNNVDLVKRGFATAIKKELGYEE